MLLTHQQFITSGLKGDKLSGGKTAASSFYKGVDSQDGTNNYTGNGVGFVF